MVDVQTMGETITQAFHGLWTGVVQNFLPDFLAAIIIFVAGWIVGALVGRVVTGLIKAVQLDKALRGAGIEDILARGGFVLDSGRFIGGLVKWFVIITFLVASLDVLGLPQVNVFLSDVVLGYLPRVFVAVFILLSGAVIAEMLQNIVSGTAKAAEITSAGLLGKVARWSIWIFAILAALYQLDVAAAFMQTLFTGIIIAVSLAVGLAFGLGGQEVARDYLIRVRDEIEKR